MKIFSISNNLTDLMWKQTDAKWFFKNRFFHDYFISSMNCFWK